MALLLGGGRGCSLCQWAPTQVCCGSVSWDTDTCSVKAHALVHSLHFSPSERNSPSAFPLERHPTPVSCFCSASAVLGHCSAPQLCPHRGPCQLPGCDPFWLLREHTPTLESHYVCSINAVSLGVCSSIVGRVYVYSDGLVLGRVDV